MPKLLISTCSPDTDVIIHMEICWQNLLVQHTERL